MQEGSRGLYTSLSSYAEIEKLIAAGEAESLHLECKAPSAPKVTRDLKAQFGKALSAFANTEGGVLLLGVSTTNHAHSNLDVLTQIEPIGTCRSFCKQIERVVPSLTTPSHTQVEAKCLVKRPRDTKGLVVLHVPKMVGDPLQSAADQLFYFRSGDESVRAPYELVRRLFASAAGPGSESSRRSAYGSNGEGCTAQESPSPRSPDICRSDAGA